MERGDIVEFVPARGARGREQRGKRFGVVLQADELLALSTVVVAPTSTRALAASFRPTISVRGRRTKLLLEQLTAVDVTRLGRPVGALSRRELDEVDEGVKLVLGLR